MDFMKQINDIPVQDIIQKYTGEKCKLHEEGTYLVVNPCPKCGHNDCCKINLDNNTLVCWSESDVRYYKPVRVLEWLQEMDTREAVLKLAMDFDISLPANFDEAYKEFQMDARKRKLMTRYAEECQKLLSPDDIKYWMEERGFTEELIKRFLIGRCPCDGSIYRTMQDEGYSREELGESGLFSGDSEYFSMNLKRSGTSILYYTLPNWKGQQVVDIQGRLVPDDRWATSLPKYMTRRGEVNHLYNPDALKKDTVFLAEGIPDTLSLIQMGFNAAGVYGVSGLKDKWVADLKGIKTVYVIFDSDEPGKMSALDTAKRIGENARIVTLDGVKDVNELLVKHGAEESRLIIEGLIRESKTALHVEIDSLPEEIDQVDEEALRDIAFGILNLQALKQEHYRGLLASHFGKSRRLIEDTLRQYRDQWKRETERLAAAQSVNTGKILLEKDPIFSRVTQCFALGKVFYAQDFMEASEEEPSHRRFAVRVITSDRNLLEPPFPAKDSREIVIWKIGDGELVLRRPIKSATMRWTKTGNPNSIDVFLASKEEKVDTVELYMRLEAMFRRYYHTPEEYDYVILALFTMFTYYYELYDAVPYLYLNGPAESGKTTTSILLQHLAFNAELVSNLTTSSLFRESEQKQMTLILDEQESISNSKANEDKGDYMAILKDGYKRTGTIKRQSPADFEITEEFHVFNPIVIANVKGLEDILRSRAIHITTRCAPASAATRITPLRPSDPDFVSEVQLIRDMLYCWVMQSHQDLRELPKFDPGDSVSNRAKELFQPLLALASYIDYTGEGREIDLVQSLHKSLPSKLMKQGAFKTRNPVELLRQACLLALADEGVTESGQQAWIYNYKIFDKLIEVNGQYSNFITLSWMGGAILSSGWLTCNEDKRRRDVRIPRRDKRTFLPIANCADMENARVQQYLLRFDLLNG